MDTPRTIDDSTPPSQGTAGLTAVEWLSRFATELGTTPPDAEEASELLALARTAAHASQHFAAPLACWLAARAGSTPLDARLIADRIGNLSETGI